MAVLMAFKISASH